MAYLVGGILIFAATLVVVMFRPYRISEAAAALVGAVGMLLGGYVSLHEAVQVLANEWNAYLFFLGLMGVSALADRAGVFDALALLAARWGGGHTRRLYLAIFLLGAVITAFLSNDATALILTPVVYALVTRLRLPPLPFMFATTFIADTASFLLPVSNPINLLVLGNSVGLGLFLRALLLPSLCAIAINTTVFTLWFHRALRLRYDLGSLNDAQSARSRAFVPTLIGLGLLGLGYVLAALVRFPLGPVALAGATLLMVIALLTDTFDWNVLREGISWALFGFISGMFIVVRGVENLGLTAAFGNALLRLGGGAPLRTILVVASGTAIGANLINNVPMALVMRAALASAHLDPTMVTTLHFATVLGADLGPNLTTVGSLATMLWVLLLRRQGLDISTREYLTLGLTVVPAMLLVGALLLWISLL